MGVETVIGALARIPRAVLFEDAPCFEHWHRRFVEQACRFERPIQWAVAGGFLSDRLGYSLAAGIQAAGRELFPSLEPHQIAALCVTEETGAHPRQLTARIEPVAGGWRLEGRKKWSTLAPRADVLFVAAVRDRDESGRNRIVLARVERSAPGVCVRAMEPTPFAPEIEHGIVELRGVEVSEQALLPGDGYASYIKPFRTLEDTFVAAAVGGSLLAAAWRYGFPRHAEGRVLAMLAVLDQVAQAEPDDPAAHLLLDAALSELDALADPAAPWWARVPDRIRELWQRDRPLLGVASRVRAQRFQRARERLGLPPDG
ncbi:MAG: acyl-CoA dehydrogenase [Candidatus Dadabacteria bacterium]|nr:MAG: acyl-CoA dehydrogenase [Candidatus Dadabacteria bacterium]